jgi:hypothetical protein
MMMVVMEVDVEIIMVVVVMVVMVEVMMFLGEVEMGVVKDPIRPFQTLSRVWKLSSLGRHM